jgi:hypothetical protein
MLEFNAQVSAVNQHHRTSTKPMRAQQLLPRASSRQKRQYRSVRWRSFLQERNRTASPAAAAAFTAAGPVFMVQHISMELVSGHIASCQDYRPNHTQPRVGGRGCIDDAVCGSMVCSSTIPQHTYTLSHFMQFSIPTPSL